MALSKDDLNAIAELLKPINGRMDKMDGRLDKMDSRLDKMDNRLDKMDNRLDKMDNRLGIIELRQNRITKKLEDLRLDMAVAERNIKQDIYVLKDEMGTVIEILKMNELLPQ